MGKSVDVRLGDVHHLITQAYLAGGPYQWAREGAVNSIQAGATWIKFGIERQGFESRGVARRYIADNGIGMNEKELKLFLSSFGGGGRKIGIGENFGQGFKSSCYEWNPYGIIVVSWTRKTPEGKMIWIHRAEEKGEIRWELKDFTASVDGREWREDCIDPVSISEIGVDVSKLKFPEIETAGQGTVFLFLGDSPTRDTELGDYMRGEKQQRGIVSYLNSRFIEVPDGVEISVESFGSRSEGSGKDTPLRSSEGDVRFLSTRRVRGIRHGIATEGAAHGCVDVGHDTTIEWYLTAQDDVIKDPTYRPASPVIIVRYEDEAYDIKASRRDFRQFGLVDEIRNRVWLIIEPPRIVEGSPKWGVTPQASRGALIAKGGQSLPWEDWQQDFYDCMPQSIVDAISESRMGESSEDEKSRRERLERVMANFGNRFAPRVLRKSKDGVEPGTPSTPGSRSSHNVRKKPQQEPEPTGRRRDDEGTSGDAVILNPEEAGKAFGNRQRKANALPAVVWDEKFTGDDRFYAARFDLRDEREGSFGTVHLNAAWPVFEAQYRYWAERHPRADGSALEQVVRAAYEDEVVTKVMHAYKLRNSIIGHDEDDKVIRLSNELVEKMTSTISLTTAVIGLINVDTKIANSLGQKFGPKKK